MISVSSRWIYEQAACLRGIGELSRDEAMEAADDEARWKLVVSNLSNRRVCLKEYICSGVPLRILDAMWFIEMLVNITWKFRAALMETLEKHDVIKKEEYLDRFGAFGVPEATRALEALKEKAREGVPMLPVLVGLIENTDEKWFGRFFE